MFVTNENIYMYYMYNKSDFNSHSKKTTHKNNKNKILFKQNDKRMKSTYTHHKYTSANIKQINFAI